MNIEKYLSASDSDLPLLSDNVGNSEVADALAHQQTEQRERRVLDIRVALNNLRSRAMSHQRNIANLKRDRKNIDKQIAQHGKARDNNRVALALLISGENLSTAQRFGLFGLLSGYSDDMPRVRAIYGVDKDADTDAIGMVAAVLLGDGELENLRKQGF